MEILGRRLARDFLVRKDMKPKTRNNSLRGVLIIGSMIMYINLDYDFSQC